jgi:hypothetical protein
VRGEREREVAQGGGREGGREGGRWEGGKEGGREGGVESKSDHYCYSRLRLLPWGHQPTPTTGWSTSRLRGSCRASLCVSTLELLIGLGSCLSGPDHAAAL